MELELSDLLPGGDWYVFESIGFWEGYGSAFVHHEVSPGVKGYVRRNEFQSNYLQVLARTKRGVIAGFYLRDALAESLLLLTKPAPASADPDVHWKNYWSTWK